MASPLDAANLLMLEMMHQEQEQLRLNYATTSGRLHRSRDLARKVEVLLKHQTNMADRKLQSLTAFSVKEEPSIRLRVTHHRRSPFIKSKEPSENKGSAHPVGYC